MDAMTIDNQNGSNANDPVEPKSVDMTGPDSPHFRVESTESASTPDVAAWEEVAEGRFMPRRVRGSYQGRALG